MHDTHAATDTVSLFTPDASGNETLAAEQRRVGELAVRLGLHGPRISALHAVGAWAVLLRPATEPGDRDRLRGYLDVMGYLPADRKLVAHAERSRGAIDKAAATLTDAFANGTLAPETFLEGKAEELPQRVAGLTRSQIEVLKCILRHQLAPRRAPTCAT